MDLTDCVSQQVNLGSREKLNVSAPCKTGQINANSIPSRLHNHVTAICVLLSVPFLPIRDWLGHRLLWLSFTKEHSQQNFCTVSFIHIEFFASFAAAIKI